MNFRVVLFFVLVLTWVSHEMFDSAILTMLSGGVLLVLGVLVFIISNIGRLPKETQSLDDLECEEEELARAARRALGPNSHVVVRLSHEETEPLSTERG
jgi:Na+-transporting methylmalonyl-CoA/oxaloacetate decarboxylase gamma subunit